VFMDYHAGGEELWNLAGDATKKAGAFQPPLLITTIPFL